MRTPNAKIEAVYPLQHLQRALLFHHLSAPAADQGLIQTRCRLHGELDRGAFATAWQHTLQRHPALRASVHWEKVSKPVWVVHPRVADGLDYEDWSGRPDAGQRAAIADLLAADRQSGLAMDQTPTSRLLLIRLAPAEHFMLWTSHHLLLDGWSAGVVLRDFMAYYTGAVAGSEVRLEAIPDQRPYLRHLQRQDGVAVENYWRDRLSRLRQPCLLPEVEGEQRAVGATLDGDVRAGFIDFCQRRRVTQNAVLQGLWAMLLGRYFGTDAVCFGITVNGRPPEIAGMDKVAGMYARILPKVVELDLEEGFFHRIQQQGVQEAVHQYVDLDQLAEWGRLGGDRLPFNTMLAVQNYPWTELAGGGLTVAEFEGDTTSRYPVTCIVLPRTDWEVTIRYSTGLPGALAEWLLDGYVALITAVSGRPAVELSELTSCLPAPPLPTAAGTGAAAPARPPYVAPTNASQLRLAGIWEQLLPVDTIGIDDHFFHCGGTSLAALRMFARLEQLTGERVAPSSLLRHPTIRQLARLLETGDTGSDWNNLVPQRVSGSLPPVFCFHGGMGHVLMYQPLMRHLHPERPVYALQPNGLDGRSELDGSIEEMAAHYLAEIDRVGAPDPLILVAYCYSGVICMAMGRHLLAAGRPAPIIIGADIDPPGVLNGLTGNRYRKPGSPRWYWGHLRLRRWTDLWEQGASDFLPDFLVGEELGLRLRARRLKNGLVEAFQGHTEQDYGYPVCLIRSADLLTWPSHDYLLETWRRIAGGQLEVRDVAGHHTEIFREPVVAETARHIEAYIASRSAESHHPPA